MPTRAEYTGHKATIELYEFEDGTCPAAEYLNGLSPSNRRKVDSLFDLMGTKGEIRNKERFKKLENSDGIFEFKSHQIRLLCFHAKTSPKKLIITHGVTKKRDKHAKADIERAEAIRSKYLGE